MTLELEERNSVRDEGENPPPNSDTCESEPEHNRIFVDLAKYRFWSGEAIPGVRRPVFIRIRTACSIAAT